MCRNRFSPPHPAFFRRSNFVYVQNCAVSLLPGQDIALEHRGQEEREYVLYERALKSEARRRLSLIMAQRFEDRSER